MKCLASMLKRHKKRKFYKLRIKLAGITGRIEAAERFGKADAYEYSHLCKKQFEIMETIEILTEQINDEIS